MDIPTVPINLTANEICELKQIISTHSNQLKLEYDAMMKGYKVYLDEGKHEGYDDPFGMELDTQDAKIEYADYLYQIIVSQFESFRTKDTNEPTIDESLF